MNRSSLNIKIAGQAGEGIKVSGLILNKAFSRLGFFTFGYSEYPSLIRGGHNTYQLVAASQPVYAADPQIDILIALNQESILLHQPELHASSLVIYDPDEFSLPRRKLKGEYLAIPLIKLATQAGGQPLMANAVAQGAVLSLLNLPLTSLLALYQQVFAQKGKAVVAQNQKAASAGAEFVTKNFKKHLRSLSLPQKKEKHLIVTGNEAIALGAIAGGLKFYAAYPMTPATSILHFLASVASQQKIVVKHTEDEIGAINMALGASFAGLRAMTATSGGGLCLMAEGISLAGVAELPIVIVNAMRPGPALGMPTWTAQGDLQFVLHIGHDEFPRLVFAPGDAQEAFELTYRAFTLAEKYQLPVIILSDKYLSESDFTCQPFPASSTHRRYGFISQPTSSYRRYRLTSTGVSLRTVPGQKNGLHVLNSYEHDSYGFATEDGPTRSQQMRKRFLKLKIMEKELLPQPIFHPEAKKLGIISWGSNKGAILQAIYDQPDIGFLHLNRLWPFPSEQVVDFIHRVRQVLVVENNSQAQLAQLIEQQTGIRIKKRLLKYDGRPFWPQEIKRELK